ncbi:uncharacterized protein LOC143624765 [Bidens hawaiensis]|uniref:uncharacterized protein LOC143624765 n=1 Tax=Bidens hawaiensis TaxID=980011 RepID=UPI00404A0356
MAIVAPKKMIAICNSGGWFNLNEDGSVACCGWEAHAVGVHENIQLIDFKKRPQPRLADTQAVVNLSPAERAPQNLTPPNEVVDIVADNGITPIPHSTRHEPHVTAKQWKNIITGVCQRFNSVAELGEKLPKYAIAHGFNYVYKKNEEERFTVKCKSKNCEWRLHASKLKSTDIMCIKTMTATHSCQADSVTTALRAQGSLFEEMLMEKVKDNPKIKPKEFAEMLKSEFGIEANYSKARRAREYAREQLLRSYNDECGEIAYKCEKLMEVNPGSVAKFSTHKGLRLFVAFNASVSGFIKGYRPLLFLDSTPINSRMLLTATSADGNDDLFPVVFAVVDDENDDNWRWYLTELKSLVSARGPINFVAKGLHEPLGEAFGGECFVGSQYYHLTCDFTQTFYSFVSKANKLSITQLVDKLRDEMMRLIYTRAAELTQWVTPLTPSMEEKLKEEILQARSVQAFAAYEGKHKVWNPYDFCSSYFSIEMYDSAYEGSINPIPDLERISDAELPARVKKRKVEPGRVVPADFLKRPLQCGRCKGLGHNKRLCKELEEVRDQSATASGRG